MKPKLRLPLAHILADVADNLRCAGELRPTHCDVRCAVNDALDAYSRDGYAVPHSYSQDRAFRTVRRQLGTL